MNRLFIISLIFVLIAAFSYLSSNKVPETTAYSEPVQKTDEALEITAEKWINSDKNLKLGQLRGKVVLIEFWTFGCYNCKNTIPHINEWYEKYQSQALEIIGIHCPEFDYESDFENVKDAVKELDIKYPVAIDNGLKNWYAYGVHAWPTIFVIDKKGEIRHSKRGEGGYKQTESVIIRLLAEN